MSNDDYRIPELPSDEELGIADLDEDDLDIDDPAGPPPPADAPPAAPPPGAPPPRRERPAVPQPGPRTRWRGPATLLVLLVAAWASASARYLPAPVPANAPDTTFASGRAMAELVALARAPRPVGSPEHTRARALIVERLTDMGLAPEIQTSLSMRSRQGGVEAVTVRNVVARIPGSASTGAIVLTAHYDAVPLSSGAGDDGTGVVTVLETARALLAGLPLENDVIILITDAEELGLLGAKAFVAEHPFMANVRVVLSVEMRGGGGPSIMFETGADNGWIVDQFRQAAPRPFASAISVEIYRRLPNDTDFSPFRDEGIQGLNFAAIDRANIYHQATDVPANIDEATLQHHGVNLLAVARHLGGADLANVNAPDRAYLTLPFVGVVAHPPSWSMIASVVVLLLAALAFVLVRARGGARIGVGLGMGALVGLASVLLSAAAGWALFRGVRGFHAEYGAIVPAFHEEGWYVVALAATAFALVTLGFGIARRRYDAGALALGALLPVVLAAAVLGFTLPLAAPLLLWPAAAGLVSAALLAGVGPERTTGIPLWVAGLLLALPVLAILVPLVELVWVAMSFRLAPMLGAALAVVLLLVLPSLDHLAHPNRWWAPAVGVLVAVGFTALGVARADAAAGRPAPSTLVYLLDREGGTSRWATTTDAGLDWARERTGAALDERGTLEPFLGGSWLTSPAPAIDAAPPVATLHRDTTHDGLRRVNFSVTSTLAPEALTLELGPDQPWSISELNGRALDVQARSLTHRGQPDEALTFTIASPAVSEASDTGGARALPLVQVIEVLLRPGLVLDPALFERPDTLAPNASRNSDRAIIRTPLRLGSGPPATLRTDSASAPVPDTTGVRRGG
jgi:hypothetical protein